MARQHYAPFTQEAKDYGILCDDVRMLLACEMKPREILRELTGISYGTIELTLARVQYIVRNTTPEEVARAQWALDNLPAE